MDIQSMLNNVTTSSSGGIAGGSGGGGNGGSTTPAQTISHGNAWMQAPGTVRWHNIPPAAYWVVQVGDTETKLKPTSNARLGNRARTTSPHGTPVTVHVRQLPNDPQHCEARFTVGSAHLSMDTAAFKERYGQSFMQFIATNRPTSQPRYVGPPMPLDVLSMIADQSSLAGLKRLRLTSKAALRVANSRVSVHLTNQNKLDQLAHSLGAGQISGLEGVNKISLSGEWVTDQTIQTLTRLLSARTSITQLDLSNCPNITRSGLVNVATNWRHLTHLSLSGCKQFTNPDVERLQWLTQLRHLDLSECTLNDNVFRHFGPRQNGTQPFSELTHLSLSKCTKITKPTHLRGLTKLEHLNFDDCKKLTNLEELQHLGNLKSLSLEHCMRLDTSSIGHIGNLTNLTHLNLFRCDLSHAHFAGLHNLRNLEFLDLSGSRIPGTVMAHIGSLTGLADLRLYHAKVDSADLNHLQGLANCLKKLDISYSGHSNATATGVPVLQFLTNLTSLKLSGCKYLDATDLPRVPLLTNLRRLDVAGWMDLTDATLQQYVQPLPNLKSLRIDWCENVTGASIQHLLNFPKLKTLNVAESGIPDDRVWELQRGIENVTAQITY
jgi:uncharacterized protein YjbI with pentapeptide repeats